MISAIVVLCLMVVLVGGFSLIVWLDTVGNRRISQVQRTVDTTSDDIKNIIAEFHQRVETIEGKMEQLEAKLDAAEQVLQMLQAYWLSLE